MTDSASCAVALIAQFCAQGVTDLVLAPGSRSAPLALAAAAADARDELRLHVRLDERSAGFLALGLAKGSRRCVPVVTTSGTAVGNLVPAVMEAHHAGVPLLVVSADRPLELVGFGVNQTTDQRGLFDSFVRYRAQVEASAAPISWQAQAARAVLAAEGSASRDPGPAHLNVALTVPLVGAATPPPPSVHEVVHAAPGPAAPTNLEAGPRTVVVCGDATPGEGRAARRAAEAGGVPLLAEPSSNARSGPNALRCGRLLLGGALAGQVQRVVVYGRPTLSRPVMALLSRDDVEVVVVGPGPRLPDPGRRARCFAAAVDLAPGDADWLAAWQSADGACGERVDAVLAAQEQLSGPRVAATVAAAAGRGLWLLGSSNPIRDADLAPIRDQPGEVFANRGLAGIDGTLATAFGIALARQEPLTVLCGDLTFLHDAGALAIGPGEPMPDVRIVVADDSGGSIFATLEYGDQRFSDVFERVFATAPGVDVAALARGYGVAARRVESVEALADAIASPVRGIEVVAVPVDRERRRRLDEALKACVS